MAAVTVTAVAAAVISWLAPQTRVAIANFALVFAVLFGLFFTGVLAIAVVQFLMRMLYRLVSRRRIRKNA